MTSKDLQSNTKKTEDQATQTPLKSVVNSGVPEWESVPVSLMTLKRRWATI